MLSSKIVFFFKRYRLKKFSGVGCLYSTFESRRRSPLREHEKVVSFFIIFYTQKSMHRCVVRSHQPDKEAIFQHRSLRNASNNMYRNLKKRYFQTQLNNYRKSPAKLWSLINLITGLQRHNFPASASTSDLEAYIFQLSTTLLTLQVTFPADLLLCLL